MKQDSTPRAGIPRWLGWAHAILLPVTAFWLSLYTVPFLLIFVFLTWGLGVVLIPVIWVMILSLLLIVSAVVPFLMLRGDDSARPSALIAAMLCAFTSTLGFAAAAYLPFLITPRLPLILLFCLLSALWYASVPWLLATRSRIPSPGSDLTQAEPAATNASSRFGEPTRELSLMLYVVLALAFLPILLMSMVGKL